MQKNAGAKPLRWLGKTNLQSKNSTPTGRCQAETGKFAEVNVSMQETLCTFYVAGGDSNVGTVFFAVGFSVMMVLDVALG